MINISKIKNLREMSFRNQEKEQFSRLIYDKAVGDYFFAVGKHKGDFVNDVVVENPGYVTYVLEHWELSQEQIEYLGSFLELSKKSCGFKLKEVVFERR